MTLPDQRVGLQRGRPVRRAMPVGDVIERIGRRVDRRRVQQQREVRQRAADDARVVLHVGERHHAVGRLHAVRAAQGDEAMRRTTDPTASHRSACRARRRRKTTRRPRPSHRCEPIDDFDASNAFHTCPDARRREVPVVGELGQVGLAHDDRARLAELGDDPGVLGRLVVREHERAARGLHVLGVEDVLGQDRDAEQRLRVARRARVVGGLGLRHRVRRDHDHRVQAQRPAVVGGDPVQVGAHDLLRGRLAGGHVGLQVGDRLAHDVVRRGRRRAQRRVLDHRAERRRGGACRRRRR